MQLIKSAVDITSDAETILPNHILLPELLVTAESGSTLMVFIDDRSCQKLMVEVENIHTERQ